MTRADLDTQLTTIAAAHRLKNDDQVGKRYGVTRQTVSGWRNGAAIRPDNERAVYNDYIDALERLTGDYPLRRLDRMRQEMRDAIGLLSPQSVEALHAMLCRQAAVDQANRWRVAAEPAEDWTPEQRAALELLQRRLADDVRKTAPNGSAAVG